MSRREVLQVGTALAAGASLLPGCAHMPERRVKPESAAALRGVIERQVAAGSAPGGVYLVAQGDEVTVEAVGVTAVQSSRPMQRDTIFRITSMTKPITAAAVMMLAEDKKLELDETVDRLLPELSHRRVLRTLSSPIDDTVPARSPITLRQLLDFTFGFGLVFDPSIPINQAAEQKGLVMGPPVPMTQHAPDEWLRRFGELPLMFQPGERWLYNAGSLVQGVLIRRASGMPFERFVEERITGPLGMKDTAFFVPPEKLERLAGCGVFTDPASGQAIRMDQDGAQSAYAAAPIFPSGAAGLVSTADDYLAFARMLLKGGDHKGTRLLRPESVYTLTHNQLTDEQRTASAKSLFPGMFDAHGWGYGMRVQVAPDATAPTPGEYGWDGGFGTTWFNVPSRNVVAIALTQSADFLFNGSVQKFREAVYAATA